MKKNKIDISFIVPIYNNSIYELKACLDSIKKNCYFSYEVLIIDDGSKKEKSNSYKKIAEQYGLNYFFKNNGGVSSARNYGLSIANGLYIFFVDADDLINASAFYNVKLNKDLIIFDIELQKDINKKISLTTKKDLLTVNDLKKCILFNGLLNWACGKLIKLDFIKKNKIKFDENRKSGEDLNFMIQVLMSDPQFEYIDKTAYRYNFDLSSADKRSMKDLKQSLKDTELVLKDRECILKELKNISKDQAKKIYEENSKSVFDIYVELIIINDNSLKDNLLPKLKISINKLAPILNKDKKYLLYKMIIERNMTYVPALYYGLRKIKHCFDRLR